MNKFSIGDCVKIIYMSQLWNNKIGVVQKISNGTDRPIRVYVNEIKMAGAFRESELEIISSRIQHSKLIAWLKK